MNYQFRYYKPIGSYCFFLKEEGIFKARIVYVHDRCKDQLDKDLYSFDYYVEGFPYSLSFGIDIFETIEECENLIDKVDLLKLKTNFINTDKLKLHTIITDKSMFFIKAFNNRNIVLGFWGIIYNLIHGI